MFYSLLAQARSDNEHIASENTAGMARVNGKMIGLPPLPGEEGYQGRLLANMDAELIRGPWQTNQAAVDAAVEFPVEFIVRGVGGKRG